MVSLAVGDAFVFLQESIVGMEAQRLGWYCKNIVLLKGEDSHVCCQSRLQLQIVVRCRDHHLVGYHITFRRSLLTHLGHLTLKGIVGEGVNSETYTLTFFYATDISLVDIGNHTHIRQILCNYEKFRSIERGCYRLTFLHRFRQDYTVDGRGNRRIAEIGLSLLNTLPRSIHLLFCLQIRQLSTLKLIGTHKSFVIERLIPIIIRELIGSRTLGTREVSLRGIQFADQIRAIQFGNDLPLLYD